MKITNILFLFFGLNLCLIFEGCKEAVNSNIKVDNPRKDILLNSEVQNKIIDKILSERQSIGFRQIEEPVHFILSNDSCSTMNSQKISLNTKLNLDGKVVFSLDRLKSKKSIIRINRICKMDSLVTADIFFDNMPDESIMLNMKFDNSGLFLQKEITGVLIE